MANSNPAGISCPGCQVGCALEKYQCGRGKEFYKLAMRGETLPEHRGFMMTPSEQTTAGEDGRPPLNHRVMHALNVAAFSIQKRHAEAGIRKILLTLRHAGSFMSLSLLPRRALLDSTEAKVALDEAQQAGYIVIETDGHIVSLARLTKTGREQADLWKNENDKKTAEFLSRLSDDEKTQLEYLIRKMLGMST